MSDDDDDVPRLSAHTLAALREFYEESSAPLRDPPGDPGGAGAAVEEDWRMSQFWYSEDTAERLAEEVALEAGGGRIACVSAPSVYQKLRQGAAAGRHRASAVLMEYDRRFSVYGDDFVFYDYNDPLSLEARVAPGSFDVVLADPPYLSRDCLEKVSQTIKYLSKGKVVLCTGAIMEDAAKELLGVTACGFVPKHERNLSNEFLCYVNYPSRLLS